MLVSDRNLVTENYADADRAILLERLDWTLRLHITGNNMPVAVRGSGLSGEGYGLPPWAVPPTSNAACEAQAREKQPTRLGVRFNNLNSGLTIIESHRSTRTRQWVKQSSVAGITARKCGLRHHIPAVYQITRCVHISNRDVPSDDLHSDDWHEMRALANVSRLFSVGGLS
ncbi:hypothetical protein N431DRAFT_509506 [Stipitochalara longipes BDJ]|nr:hypothetical protein N431DRAFT_509506 [Stipitochalara longipes BDJ]